MVMTEINKPPETFMPETAAPELAEETYHRLLNMIALGRIPRDVPLQERTLAAALGVSRTPLREAISRLIGGGFASRAGRGQLMVKEPSLRDYLSILQLRQLLEGESAASATGRMPPALAASLITQIEQHRVAHDGSIYENHRIDNLVHMTIAAHSGNTMLEQMIFDLRIKARSFDQNGTAARFEPGCEEHIAILRHIGNGDAEGARAAMVRHLAQVRAGIVARFTEF